MGSGENPVVGVYYPDREVDISAVFRCRKTVALYGFDLAASGKNTPYFFNCNRNEQDIVFTVWNLWKRKKHRDFS